MEDFWNKRYSSEEYAYGEEPNEFFRSKILEIPPGKLLLPAEGEGRNSVFAAQMGWEVTAFDSSSAALKKAGQLAKAKNVRIEYLHGSLNNIEIKKDYFDCIALIFVHPQTENREVTHKNLLSYLNKGGRIILEGFSKNQIDKSSGGPKNIDMLFSEEIIRNDFSQLKNLTVWEEEIILNEGKFHQGPASVVRLFGEK